MAALTIGCYGSLQASHFQNCQFFVETLTIYERKLNNNESMCSPMGFMHRCYFVGHQDETGCIKIFLLSLSENRSMQACA